MSNINRISTSKISDTSSSDNQSSSADGNLQEKNNEDFDKLQALRNKMTAPSPDISNNT